MEARDFISDFKENTGRLPSQVELSKGLKISPQAAIQELINFVQGDSPPEYKQAAEFRDFRVAVLRAFLILLSAMAFILSTYFTALWFIGKFPLLISGLISISMVLFMVISPQTLRYVHNNLVKWVVYISFIVAMFFSMGSTVSGQYNKTTEMIEDRPDKAFIFQSTLEQEKEVKSLIEDAQKDKAVHQAAIMVLSETEEKRLDNWQSIATERKYIELFDARIDILRKELGEVRTNQLNNGIVEEKRDFYLFISELTGMEKSFTEFLITAMPAIFIDLISALCLNLALYIGKSNDNNKARKRKTGREV